MRDQNLDAELTSEDLEITAKLDRSELEKGDLAETTGYRLLDRNGTVYDLLEGINTIGRLKRGNNVHVKDKFCSAMHAEVNVSEGIATITDIGSTNGTFVNGIRLAPGTSQTLASGDEINLGHTYLRVEAIKQ